MTGHDLSKTPPMSPMLVALLAQERDYGPSPEMVRARLLARARQAMSAPKIPVSERHVAWPVRRMLYAAAAGLVLVAGGAAAYELLAHPSPPASPPPRDVPPRAHLAKVTAPEQMEPPAPETAPAPVEPAPLASPPEAEPTHRASAAGKSEARLKEIRLLVRARQADARRDYATVLSVAAEHERSFPAGRLSEERQVLRVKALVGLGWADEARRVGANFRRQFPHSVLRQTVDEMLASIR